MLIQILGRATTELYLLLVILSFIFILILITYRYKIALKSVEFKVVAFYCLGVATLLIITVFAILFFDSDLLITIIMVPPAIIFMIYSLIYILKVIRRQESSLTKIIKNAENVAINIANIATELSASSSEVNAASEEIALTAQDVAQDSNEIMASAGFINEIMSILTSISD